MTSVGSNFLCGSPPGTDRPSHIRMRPPEPNRSPPMWTSWTDGPN